MLILTVTTIINYREENDETARPFPTQPFHQGCDFWGSRLWTELLSPQQKKSDWLTR